MTHGAERGKREGKKLTEAILLLGRTGDDADIRYASGYSAVDPTVYMEAGKRKWLIVPLLEKGRAKREARRGVTVLTPADLDLSKARQRSLSRWIEGVLLKEKLRRIKVSSWCPIGIVERLRRRGIRVRVCPKPVFPKRACKSASEITAITEAQIAAVSALRAAIAFLKSARISKENYLFVRNRKATADDVRRIIDHVLLEHDCMSVGTIVACGSLGADPHERGSGLLRANEPIVLDIFPQHRKTGYWGDLSRTVVRGAVPKKVKQMYRAVKTAQAAALKRIRHGVSVQSVHAAARKSMEAAGFVTRIHKERPEGFIHSTGHGVGLEIHESPAVGSVAGRLRQGNVVTVEPGLYYAEVGGMRIEDTVLVTRNGYRMLCKAPVVLEV